MRTIEIATIYTLYANTRVEKENQNISNLFPYCVLEVFVGRMLNYPDNKTS